MNVADDGLRQRSTAAASVGSTTPAKQPDDSSDMAYGSGRNRPVLATSIRRTISSGLYSSNRVLRRYFNRILFVFAVTAIYTIYIYKSGALSFPRLRVQSFSYRRLLVWPWRNLET
jgi:hypothetical protein